MINEQFLSQWGGLIVFLVLCANLFFYGFINWKSFKGDLKTFTILDISTITAITSLFFLRVITVIALKPNFFNMGWRMILEFFSFADGQFAYTGLILGLIISTNLIFRSSNQLKSIRFLLDKITIGIAILTFFDMVILIGLVAAGLNVADKIAVISVAILSLVTLIMSRIGKVRNNRGMLSAIFIILGGVVAISVNVIRANATGAWQIEFESVVALILLIYGIIELISALPKRVIEDVEENELRASGKTRMEYMRSSGSPLKYSQSFAKTDDVFADFSVREKVASRIKNLKRKAK